MYMENGMTINGGTLKYDFFKNKLERGVKYQIKLLVNFKFGTIKAFHNGVDQGFICKDDASLKEGEFVLTFLSGGSAKTTVTLGHDSKFVNSLTAEDLKKVAPYTDEEREKKQKIITQVIEEKITMSAGS